MLCVCTSDMHFVYVLPGWKGFVADGWILRDAISRRHGLKVHHEDDALVSCMVNLHNVGTFNVDTGFKATVYDMRNRKDNNGFGWDEHRQMVVVEDAVWNSYVTIGKYAQTTTDIVEEIDAEDVAIAKSLEEGNNYHGCEGDVSLDEMDVSATQSQPSTPNQDNAATLLGENILTVGLELSRRIASEMIFQRNSEMVIQESAQKLYMAFCEVEGLTEDECYHALSKIPDHPMQMLIFFSVPSSV
ncbi:hypothetical protein Gotur_005146 [Gossypium turneri]